MKLGISRILLAAAMALAFTSTLYSQTVNIRAQVPFSFAVGDRSYPAGEYAVQTLVSHSHLALVGNRNEAKSAMTPTHPVDSAKLATDTVLLFHRVGDGYFLYQVWAAGSRVGLEFPQSRREEQMARKGTKAETIAIAANIAK